MSAPKTPFQSPPSSSFPPQLKISPKPHLNFPLKKPPSKILCSQQQQPNPTTTTAALISILKSLPDWADNIKEQRMKQTRPLYKHQDWVRHRSSYRHIRHLLSSLNSRVILSLVPPVIAFTSVAAFVASYNTAVLWHLLPEVFPVLRASSLPYQLTAPALALLLVFRTEASYSRFEEGRKAWSKVISGTNDFARQVIASVDDNDKDLCMKTSLLQYIMAFPVALKCHLVYESDIGRDLGYLLEDDDLAIVLGSKHRPRCIIQFISQSMKLLDLEEPKRTVLESKVTCFHEGIGVCEQIMGIPIPLSYTRLTSRFLVLWHLTLPIMLWDDCNWIVVPATFVSAASLFCIEEAFCKEKNMDKFEDLEDINSDTGFQSSPISSMDQSPTTRNGNSFAYCRTSSETSGFSEQLTDDFNSCSSESNSPVCWPGTGRSPYMPTLSRFGAMKHNLKLEKDDKANDQKPSDLELEMMKERFSKLLLGEDMSGSGKGVSTAVTVSNAITNLYVSMFGQHQRLEPLYRDKKTTWKREMTCLLSVCDYIVEFVPASQYAASMEMMISRPRSDIDINLPALIKLDALLIEILESFQETEFWYNEQGSVSGGHSQTESFRRTPQPQRTEDKWWLPVPCVSDEGLSEMAKKHLKQKRDAANQIYKAAMAINNNVLSDMEIPHTYTASLPKSGRTSVGDTIYRYMTSTNRFSPEYLLDCLNISSEHEALELADRVEASMFTWRQKACSNFPNSSWESVKEHMEGEKNVVLAERAEVLLFSLKQRFPELAQTTLDTTKIQYNRDVGQAILESYSRVLEGLAFNIVGWVEDVLFVDQSITNQHQEC